MTNIKLKVKKDDEVIVLTGKNKGQKGKVVKSMPKENKVIVAGINIVKKHQKADAMGKKAGIVEIEKPINASNVALVDPKDGKATKVGYKTLEDGKKVRVSKRTGEVIA
ncbi:MAG: 50S ribosomal protein L24 [Alphaproteobacteria bacterium]|jgi:large subunit ribosomal protein L24|nr:50S ribosomal protein L24 [Alphaproteobacteria bacterium]